MARAAARTRRPCAGPASRHRPERSPSRGPTARSDSRWLESPTAATACGVRAQASATAAWTLPRSPRRPARPSPAADRAATGALARATIAPRRRPARPWSRVPWSIASTFMRGSAPTHGVRRFGDPAGGQPEAVGAVLASSRWARTLRARREPHRHRARAGHHLGDRAAQAAVTVCLLHRDDAPRLARPPRASPRCPAGHVGMSSTRAPIPGSERLGGVQRARRPVPQATIVTSPPSRSVVARPSSNIVVASWTSGTCIRHADEHRALGARRPAHGRRGRHRVGRHDHGRLAIARSPGEVLDRVVRRAELPVGDARGLAAQLDVRVASRRRRP